MVVTQEWYSITDLHQDGEGSSHGVCVAGGEGADYQVVSCLRLGCQRE